MIEQALPSDPASPPGSAVLEWTAEWEGAAPPDALARLQRLARRLASHPDALELLADIDAVREALATHGAVTERLSFMSAVADVLERPLEIEAALGRVAELVVPGLADSCVLYLLDEARRTRSVIARHADPERLGVLRLAARRFAPGSGKRSGVGALAVETGEPVFLPDAEPDLFERRMPVREAERLRTVQPCSAMALPLKARARTLGVLTLQMSSSQRRFSPAELDVARELADRVAIALENAMLLREAEEARALLDTLFRSTPVGLALLDQQLRLVRLNDAMASLLGRDARSLRGRPVVDADEEFAAFVAPRAPRMLDGPIPLMTGELGRAGPAGRPVYWLVTLYPVRTPAGKCLGLGIAVVDITARKEAELSAQAAREAAEAASSAKSQFLAVISHELRTPLTTVIGYADLLAAGTVGGMTLRQRDHLGRIRTSAWHLVGIIDEILTFSRADAGKERAHLQLLDVAALAREAAETMEPLAQARGLAFVMRGLDEPRRVLTDGGKIRQILLNLLGNALKFTEAGGIELELAELEGEVQLRVKDTGPGIPAEHLEAVFEPFRQLDQSNTRQVGGTGLGLTVSRQLARLLGGDVTVESRTGVGSVFTLAVPARKDQSPASTWISAVPAGV